jgi:hypothetical protein
MVEGGKTTRAAHDQRSRQTRTFHGKAGFTPLCLSHIPLRGKGLEGRQAAEVTTDRLSSDSPCYGGVGWRKVWGAEYLLPLQSS